MARRVGKNASMTLFDSLIEGAVLIRSVSGRVVLANKAAAAIFGYESPEKMVGVDPLDHITPEDKGRIAGVMAGYFVEGDLQRTMDIRAVALDGREVWVTAVGVRSEHEGETAGLILMKDITAQKAAERALAEAEESQRQILDNANESILVLQDGNVVFANRKALELGSFSEEEIRGRPFVDFLVPEDRERILRRYVKKAESRDYASTFVVRGLGKNGNIRWSEIREASFMWEGKPAEICLVKDITEQKRAEEALEVSEKRYRLLTENVSDVIWVTDLQLKPTYFNPSVTHLLGYSVEEAMAGALKMTPASLDDAWRAFAQAMEKEERDPGGASGAPKMDLEYIHKDGSTVWAETTVSFLRDSKGEPFAVLGILHDVSERREAEEALRKSEERFRALIENASDAIIVLSAKGEIVYESPNSQRAVERKVSGLFGPQLLQVIHPDDVKKILDLFELIKDRPGKGVETEVRFKHKDGTWHTIEGNARNLLRDPRVNGIVINYRNTTEKRNAEAALRESEKRYRLLADNVADVIFLLDMNLRPTYFSPSAAHLTGHSIEEIMAGTLEARMTVRSIQVVEQTLAEALSDEKREPGSVTSRSLEVEVTHKDGSTRLTDAMVSFLRDSEGQPIGIVGILHDLTEKRKAEEALRDSEKRYRLLAENLSDVIWVITTDLKFTYVSPSVERLLGYTAEEAVTLPTQQMVSPASFEMAMRVMAEEERKEQSGTSDRERSVTLELELPRKDGSTVWTENRASYLRDSSGRVSGFLGVSRDISERKKAQAALQASEERFRTLIEESTDAIAIVDTVGNLLYESPSMERITGYKQEDWVGKPIGDWFLHPDDMVVLASTLERVLSEANATLEGLTARYRHKDGTWHTLEATVRNLVHDPKVGGLLINYRDITERVKAEEDLRASEERFRTIFEQSPVGAIIYDSKGITVGSNKACLEIFGLSDLSEMKGPTLFDDPNLSDRAKQKLRLGKSVVGEGSLDLEKAKGTGLYNNTRSGTVNLRLTVTPLGADKEESPSGYLALVEDITERKKAENALRASEERFRTIFEQSPIGTIVYDAAGVASGANRACMEIFGLSGAADLKGPVLFDDPLLSDGAKRRLRAGKIVVAEARINLDEAKRIHSYKYGRSGTVDLRLTVTPLGADKEGAASGYLALVEDITGRKRAEEALRASEERFRGLVETTSDWVWEVDRGGVYTYVSPKVRKVLGYESEELVGKTPFDFMLQREACRVAAVFDSFVAKQLPFAFLENVNRHKDGHPVVLESSGVPFFAPDGTLLGYRGVDRDITERKQVAKQLQQSLKRLERTMEATIQAISTTIETRDPYTAGHQRRVTQLAGVIARDMNLFSAQIAGIRVAGLLHDIGKISVPTEILSKPGLLTDVEMSMIRIHPKIGYDILKNMEFEWPVAQIVLQHHERLDGSGYPAGIRGDKILLEARILAVSDVVEAMSSHRPYRPAVGTEKALAEITRGAGTLYDSSVVRACLEAFTKNGFKFEE